MERRFAIFLWKLFHMGAIHHTLIENTRTCLLNVPCAATVWKVTNDAFSSKNHACHLWIRTAWGRKWFGVTPCKTKLVKLLRSPFSPLFQTGNSKIYTLIKTAYTRHFTIIFSWMHTVNTKKNRSGPVRTGEAKSFEYTSHNLSLCDEQWMGGADCECAHVTVYLFVRSRENGCMHIRHICVYRHCVHRYIGFLFLPFFLVCV